MKIFVLKTMEKIEILKQILLESKFFEDDDANIKEQSNETIDEYNRKVLDFFELISELDINIDLPILVEFYEGNHDFKRYQYENLLKTLNFLISDKLQEGIIFAKTLYPDICEIFLGDVKIFCENIKLEDTLFLSFCKYGIINRIDEFYSDDDVIYGYDLACEEGSVLAVEKLLNIINDSSLTDEGIIIASEHGRYNVVEFLLDHVQNEESKNDAFKHAIFRKDYNIVKLFLDHGLDQDVINNEFRYSKLNLELIKLMMNYKIDRDDYGNMIEDASIDDDIDVLKLLINDKTSITILNNSLVSATIEGNYDVVEFLLSYGIKEGPKYAALEEACKYKDYKLIKLLLNNEKNFNFLYSIKDGIMNFDEIDENIRKLGQIVASVEEKYEILQQLLNMDDVMIFTIDAVIFLENEINYKILKLLLDNNIDHEMINTYFYRAVGIKNYKLMEFLFNYNISLNALINILTSNDDVETFRIILENSTEINKDIKNKWINLLPL